MQVLVWIVIAIAVAFAIRNPLKAVPWVFYASAVAVDVLVLCGANWGFSGGAWSLFYTVNRRTVPAFALFTVVMFVGCLKKGSRARHWLLAVRAELSILACILSIPHILFYLDVYDRLMFNEMVHPTTITYQAYWFSVGLTIVLGMLGVLSFRIVRRHMLYSVWKNIQRLAYSFFVLIWAHVVLLRLRPDPNAVESVLLSSWVYGAIVAVYVVWRLARFAIDRRACRGLPK